MVISTIVFFFLSFSIFRPLLLNPKDVFVNCLASFHNEKKIYLYLRNDVLSISSLLQEGDGVVDLAT